MKKTTFRRICGTVCLLGFLLMLGTAGASDCDMITIRQIIARSVIGMVMFVSGGYLGGVMQ